jgi:hypothetical protein
MAFFSIPTSVGGIQLPDNFIGGPLTSLYTKGGLDYTQYPRDLGSDTRQHSVLFTVEEIKELGTEGLKEGFASGVDSISNSIGGISSSSIGAAASDLWSSLVSNVEKASTNSVRDNVVGAGNSIIDAAGDLSKGISNFAKTVTNTSGTPVAYVELYIPETLNFSTNMSYDDSTTLASAAGALPLIGSVVSKVTGGMQSDIAKLALNKAGYVFNPQKQMLFQGLEFRQFNMTFTFTPYSQDEAVAVREIIKTFRKWSAPKLSDSFGGMFWTPPALFNIDFRFKGATNPNLPRLNRCVIESVDVNYAPNGWSAHADGAPVQTQMTLQFQEIVLIDRGMVDQGY